MPFVRNRFGSLCTSHLLALEVILIVLCVVYRLFWKARWQTIKNKTRELGSVRDRLVVK